MKIIVCDVCKKSIPQFDEMMCCKIKKRVIDYDGTSWFGYEKIDVCKDCLSAILSAKGMKLKHR